MNYFEIFGINMAAQLNIAEVEKTYISLQKKYAQIGDDIALADINFAYQIFKDDYKRVAHILKIQGIDLSNEEIAKSYIDFNSLNEIYLLREKLDETGDISALLSLQETQNFEITKMLIEIDELIKLGALEDAAKLAIRLKYAKTYLLEIEKKLEKCL